MNVTEYVKKTIKKFNVQCTFMVVIFLNKKMQ